MQVFVYSREAIEELLGCEFPDNAAVISFFDPPSSRTSKNYLPVDFHGKCPRLIAIGLHDIDIETLEDYGLTYETYFPEAEKLARFILSAESDGLDIICQCEYGQSRSAACAAAIKEYFDGSGIEIFADYRYYPNQLVFNKLLTALKTIGTTGRNGPDD